MNLLTLGLKDLRRRPTRSLLTIGGIALATATLASLLSFSRGYDIALRREMKESGIHMFVSTEGCPMEAASLVLHGGEVPKFLPEARVAPIQATPGVNAVTRMLLFAVPGEGRRIDLFYGADDTLPKLKPHWKLTGQWFTGADSIVLGAQAAKLEKRGVGERVTFPELGKTFTVSGVLDRTGGEDDGWFFIPLETAQGMFQKEGKLTGVGVQLVDVQNTDVVKGRLESLPDVYVVTAKQMTDQILKLVGSSKTLMFAVLGIALAIAVLGVLNTVLMSVMEKLREFGYLRCVGASRADIFKLVLLETVTLCAFGGLIGVAIGVIGSTVADGIIRGLLPYAPSGRLVAYSPDVLGSAVLAAMGIGALAGLYPSWQASRVSPMEAVRSE